MKKYIITEQQAVNFLRLAEAIETQNTKLNVSLPSDQLTDTEKQNPALALKRTQNIAKTQGFPNNTNYTTNTEVNGKDMEITAKPTNESSGYMLTKEQIEKLKLYNLKENSQIIKIKDFK